MRKVNKHEKWNEKRVHKGTRENTGDKELEKCTRFALNLLHTDPSQRVLMHLVCFCLSFNCLCYLLVQFRQGEGKKGEDNQNKPLQGQSAFLGQTKRRRKRWEGKLVLIECTNQQEAGQRRKQRRTLIRGKYQWWVVAKGQWVIMTSFPFLFSRSCIATLFFVSSWKAKKRESKECV